MILEILFIAAFLFLVLVFFYKQGATEFHILQVESDKMENLSELLSEQDPLVIRGLGQPTFLTPDTLKKNARIQTFPAAPGLTLAQYLSGEGKGHPQPTLTQEMRSQFATEVGVPMWANHTWFKPITEDLPYGFLMSMDSEAYLSSMGMRKTTAAYTLLYPTSGTFTCSLIMGSSTKFLPDAWEGRFVADLGPQDTPLLHEVQYLDVILRPGTMLIVPPHWIVSMALKEPAVPLFAWIELHHPISKLAKALT
jgi:hypothetical protein